MRISATSLLPAALSMGLGCFATPSLAGEASPTTLETNTEDTRHTTALAPLISQADIDDETSTQDEEDAWRVYLDMYAFLPLETNSTTTINDNATSVNVPLSSILDTLTGALTFKASAEYGRLGFMAGVNHSANSASTSASSLVETQNPLRKLLGVQADAGLIKTKVTIKGDIDVDLDMNQTIVDLAMRYRAGDIQKPRMKKGSTSFVGLAGARIIDANLSTNVDLRLNGKATINGLQLNREWNAELEESLSDSWGNTWVQPMIGMMATYAFSNDWQAFAYLDAGGFGLAGERDLSGTAQVGIAYALGNSAQASLSYKYFGLDYAGGSGNGYTTSQSGVNLGLRWLFD